MEKPKLELFSKLALIALLLNIGIAISIIFLVFYFPFSQVLIALIIINLLGPVLNLILAFMGISAIKKHPDKYKKPLLAQYVMAFSGLLISLSLLFFAIFIFVSGVSVAVW